MITHTIAGHTIKVYDSIDNMPIINFHVHNRLMLIDSGIGSELSDIDSHIVKIANFISTNPNLAVKELTNLQQSLYYISQNVSPKYLAYMAFINEFDGEKVTDLSDENLMKLFNKLNTESVSLLDKVFKFLKKKISDELEIYFPSVINDVSVKEIYGLIKRRTNILLHQIITNEDVSKDLEDINNTIIGHDKPKTFNGKDSILIKMDKQFEQMCLVISQKLNSNAKVMTVAEYYNAVEIISDKKFG